MNLREEFKSIMRKYGYPVLVLRRDKQARCSCFNCKTMEADRECPVCFGLGVVPIIEKHTVRERDTSVPETLTMIAQSGAFGGMSVPGRQYYVFHDLTPLPRDLIVDVDWTEQGQPVYSGRGIYEISHVDPARFEHGEIIYNTVYCKDQPVQKSIRGIRIANSNGILNYEILPEGGAL